MKQKLGEREKQASRATPRIHYVFLSLWRARNHAVRYRLHYAAAVRSGFNTTTSFLTAMTRGADASWAERRESRPEAASYRRCPTPRASEAGRPSPFGVGCGGARGIVGGRQGGMGALVGGVMCIGYTGGECVSVCVCKSTNLYVHV